MPSASNRLLVALLAYGALAASAFFTLTGTVRIFILILFAGLALKTWASLEKEKLADAEQSSPDGEDESGTPPSEPQERR